MRERPGRRRRTSHSSIDVPTATAPMRACSATRPLQCSVISSCMTTSRPEPVLGELIRAYRWGASATSTGRHRRHPVRDSTAGALGECGLARGLDADRRRNLLFRGSRPQLAKRVTLRNLAEDARPARADPDGAITAARPLLETVRKHMLDSPVRNIRTTPNCRSSGNVRRAFEDHA